MEEVKVEQLEPADEELLEEWARITDEDHILGVNAARSESEWPWQVSIPAAEFMRTEPIESELHEAITNALSGVPGVSQVVHEDREVWVVQGEVAGDSLVRACSIALNNLAGKLRSAYEEL